MPSAAMICSLNNFHSFGGVDLRSSLNIGNPPILTILRDSVSGAKAIIALAGLKLYDSLRKLPTKIAILYFF